MNFNNISKTTFRATVLLAALLSVFVACTSESNGEGETREATTAPISLTLAVPERSQISPQSRSVGDPGDSIQEVYEDWNRLTIIVAYKDKEKATETNGIYDPEPNKMIYMDTFTKAQFEETKNKDVTLANGSVLSKADVNGFRSYTMYVPQGTVNVYGVTYSVNDSEATQNSKLDFDPVIALEDKASSIGSDETASGIVEALTISNDYAGTDYPKFMSVATGYATILDAEGNKTNNRDLKITLGNEAYMKKYWRMPLTRLATKLDIQWDAYQGYNDGKLEDCKVTFFQYDGGATNETGSGYGRLFPSLQSDGVTAVGGKKEFYNESPISQRNGRVYHYLYPDGSKNPKITFNLDIKEKDKDTGKTTETGNKPISFLLQKIAPLKQATWYKINTKIKGSSATTEFVIGKSSDTNGNNQDDNN